MKVVNLARNVIPAPARSRVRRHRQWQAAGARHHRPQLLQAPRQHRQNPPAPPAHAKKRKRSPANALLRAAGSHSLNGKESSHSPPATRGKPQRWMPTPPLRCPERGHQTAPHTPRSPCAWIGSVRQACFLPSSPRLLYNAATAAETTAEAAKSALLDLSAESLSMPMVVASHT